MKVKWERTDFTEHAIAFDLAYYMVEMQEVRIKGVEDKE